MANSGGAVAWGEARGGAGLRRRLLELLAGSVLTLLVVRLASALAACAGQHRAGPCQALGSADGSALGVAAPLLLGAVAAAAAWAGWRARVPALLRAAGAAALLALADALSLPARLGPGLAAALDLRPLLGFPAPRFGGALVGAAVVAAAVLLLAPRSGADAAGRRLRRALLVTVLALAALQLLSSVAEGWIGVTARWPVLADAAEEAGEGLAAAWAAASLPQRLSDTPSLSSPNKTFLPEGFSADREGARPLAPPRRKQTFLISQRDCSGDYG